MREGECDDTKIGEDDEARWCSGENGSTGGRGRRYAVEEVMESRREGMSEGWRDWGPDHICVLAIMGRRIDTVRWAASIQL